MTIQIYAMNAKMDSIEIQIPLVSFVQATAATEHYVISIMVLVLKAARKIGQKKSAILHAHPTAESVNSLANIPVHCVKTRFTETAVSIHAIQGVLNETNPIHATKTMLHVILTVRNHSGALNVISNVVWAAVNMFAIDRRDIA